MQLEQRRLLIRVRNIDDLEKIYKLLCFNSSKVVNLAKAMFSVFLIIRHSLGYITSSLICYLF